MNVPPGPLNVMRDRGARPGSPVTVPETRERASEPPGSTGATRVRLRGRRSLLRLGSGSGGSAVPGAGAGTVVGDDGRRRRGLGGRRGRRGVGAGAPRPRPGWSTGAGEPPAVSAATLTAKAATSASAPPPCTRRRRRPSSWAACGDERALPLARDGRLRVAEVGRSEVRHQWCSWSSTRRRRRPSTCGGLRARGWRAASPIPPSSRGPWPHRLRGGRRGTAGRGPRVGVVTGCRALGGGRPAGRRDRARSRRGCSASASVSTRCRRRQASIARLPATRTTHASA